MNFLELLQKRHSIRNYKDQVVEDSVLDFLISQAQLAPSSRNKKTCGFIKITDRPTLQKLSLSKNAGSQMLSKAAAAIVVTGDAQKSDVWIEDCSIAMTYLHLAATDQGLGSCWIQIRNRKTADETDSQEYVKQLLNLPQNQQVLAILSIGIPE